MKISIVTVVYNNERTIENAIQSVAEQRLASVEHIIIDGNSSDATCQIIQSHGDKISKFISEEDKGIYDAMNKGLAIASGSIIGILNSDDMYSDPDVLNEVLHEFESDPDLDLLYGDLDYVSYNDSGKVIRKWRSKQYYDSFFEDGNVPPHPTLFVKSHVYEKAGCFNLSYKLAADYEFMLRVFKKHLFKSKYLNRRMIKMRLGGATNKSFKNVVDGNIEILRSWGENGLSAPFLLMPRRIIKRIMQFF